MHQYSVLFLSCYFTVLASLAIFGWHRYYLTFLYYRFQKKRPQGVPRFEDLPEIPRVTVQIPIFNEKYVVERIVEKACGLDYPQDRLEIQILDDSTDETVEIAGNIVERFQRLGVNIHHIRRANRIGFKAGALDAGMQVTEGRYIAIFDADFLPPADFLKRLIPYFYTQENYGLIQARWGHVNQDYSLMTQAQSVLLDGHFVIEHAARNRSGRFFNFNGTAGIWDRRCVEQAGGWQHDTLTEDLDLSYRAQLIGWNFLYVPEVVVPAELPVDMNAFKSQQHRWAKGSIQTAKKMIPKILRSKLPLKVKLEACFHLLNNFAYVLMVVLSLMMPYSIFLRNQYGWKGSIWIDLPVFILATCSVGAFYACSQREVYADWKFRLLYLPCNLALGIGLAVNNTKAVIEALLGRESEFKRTAKFAIAKKSDRWQNKKYKSPLSLVTVTEILLGLYFSAAVAYAIAYEMWASLYSLMFFQVGFLYVGLMSFFQGKSGFHWMPRWKASSVPVE